MKEFRKKFKCDDGHFDDAKHILVTSFDDEWQYALYKKIGEYFILVDSFSDINEATEESRNVILKK